MSEGQMLLFHTPDLEKYLSYPNIYSSGGVLCRNFVASKRRGSWTEGLRITGSKKNISDTQAAHY
jgi:hypothetical protein